MKKKAVVFAPHPDDETLGCGGVIAKKVDEGYDVSVVFITDGRHSLTELGISSKITPIEMKEMRRKEAIKATEILGLHENNLLFLDYEDTTLEENREHVQKRIIKVLKDVSPNEVFFPQEREYNIDHRLTSVIVREAIRISKLHPVEYQYVIAWSFPFYLLLHVVGEHTFDLLTSSFLKKNLILVDITEFLSLKEAAIQKYKSQITVISNEQNRPALKHSFLKRFLKNEEKFFVNVQSN